MSKTRQKVEVQFNIDPKTIKSPEIKRRVKNIFDEMQDEYEREQVKGKGYEEEVAPVKRYKVGKK